MITWFVGNSGAGKTTAAGELAARRESVLLDADVLREVWPGLGYTAADRTEQNLRLARLARMLADQGFDVVLASINPLRAVRLACEAILSPLHLLRWVWVTGGDDRGFPFEVPRATDGYEIWGERSGQSEYDRRATRA